MSATETAAIRARVAARLLRDASGEGLRPLEDYLARHPAYASIVRAEYQVLVGGASSGGNAVEDGEDDDEDLRPASFGALEFGVCLGRGGSGRVWAAHHRHLGLPVAVKVLRYDINALEGGLERMRREACIGVTVPDRHLVRVLDLIPHEGRWHLVMERVLGHDLRSEVQRVGALSLAHASTILAQVAEGLAALHSEGIVHCDVKPENILLDEHGVAKVTDYGIASLSTDPQRPASGEAVLGTWRYLAPELFTREARATVASDVYSLGLVALFLRTGRHVLSGARAGQSEAEAPDPSEREEELATALRACTEGPERELLRACLDRDPSRRPADASLVAERFRQLATDCDPGSRCVDPVCGVKEAAFGPPRSFEGVWCPRAQALPEGNSAGPDWRRLTAGERLELAQEIVAGGIDEALHRLERRDPQLAEGLASALIELPERTLLADLVVDPGHAAQRSWSQLSASELRAALADLHGERGVTRDARRVWAVALRLVARGAPFRWWLGSLEDPTSLLPTLRQARSDPR